MTEKNTKPLGFGFWIRRYIIDLAIAITATYLLANQSFVLPMFLGITILNLLWFARYEQGLPYQKVAGKQTA